MRQKLVSLWANKMFRGTSLLWLGSMGVNFGGFVYHLVMARLLTPIDYGILGSLIGLLYFANIPVGTVDLVVTKLVAQTADDRHLGQLVTLVTRLGKWLGWGMAVSVPFLLMATSPVANFLHLEGRLPVNLVWLSMELLLVSAFLTAFLKGRLQFVPVIVIQVAGMAARIGLSWVLVLAIGSYLGAVLGIVAAWVVALALLSGYILPSFLAATPAQGEPLPRMGIKKLGVSSLLLTSAFTLMYSADIVLVKHFLPEYWAGMYAVLATAGKVVFFSTIPVGLAVLPVVAKKAAHPHQARSDLYLSLVMTAVIGLGVVAVFALFPQTVVRVMFTTKFLPAAAYLPLMGVAMFLYSLASVLGNFLMAISQFKVGLVALAALVVEGGLLAVYHGHLGQIIASLVVVFGILALTLLGWSLYVTRGRS